MKLRWKITVGLAMVGAFGAWAMLRPDSREKRAAEETRRALRQQGFKTDLAEFDFSTTAEIRARMAALTNADWRSFGGGIGAGFPETVLLLRVQPDLMEPAGSNGAVVVWREARLPIRAPAPWLQPEFDRHQADDLWPLLREALRERRVQLDAVRGAALSGPIRFDLEARHGSRMLLRQLPVLRQINRTLATATVVDLHEQSNDAAWTNLLAMTRLVTAWEPEPSEISYVVRYGCASLAFNATWQALQKGGWPDQQLAALQREWESADFFRGLPETAAFARASAAETCQLERQQHIRPGIPFKELIRSPQFTWASLTSYVRQLHYRHHGSYADERALLLYYSDREVELRQAVQAPTWLAMRSLPGVTNPPPFKSAFSSATQVAVAQRQRNLAFQSGRQGLLGRAAEAETVRRLAITAIALERYHERHGVYPKALDELGPDCLEKLPVDFMDGQPLRYRLTGDGHFVLYSVGLDGVDDGGELSPHGPDEAYTELTSAGRQRRSSLVWPRPATPAEADAHFEEQKQALEEKQKQAELTRLREEKQEEIARQETVAELLARKPARPGREPEYQGRRLSRILEGETAASHNARTLDELLTLRQVITGQEPDIATFELPVRYDVLTNIGSLHLLVDAEPAEFSEGAGGEEQEWTRSTNGNCRLVWNTTYDPPGQHALQAQLLCMEGNPRNPRTLEVKGPVAPFFSSNICQFDSSLAEFDDTGATLYAKLPESNGIYTIELKSPAGKAIKTLNGTTSNGVINVHWNLIDEAGRRYTNDSVDTVFHVTLPGSGRSQTVKGP